MNKQLRELFERAETWPAPAQDELVRAALEIEAEQGSDYRASAAELLAIDEGLRQVRRGEIASDEAVKVAFGRFRPG